MPAVSAPEGSSPDARMARPHLVRKSRNQVMGTSRKARYSVQSFLNSAGPMESEVVLAKSSV